jgi:hypothetical protein
MVILQPRIARQVTVTAAAEHAIATGMASALMAAPAAAARTAA